jgi:hypothetical protein
MKTRLQLILFALENLVKETKQPIHPLYSTVAARKIQDATALIKEILEEIRP